MSEKSSPKSTQNLTNDVYPVKGFPLDQLRILFCHLMMIKTIGDFVDKYIYKIRPWPYTTIDGIRKDGRRKNTNWKRVLGVKE